MKQKYHILVVHVATLLVILASAYYAVKTGAPFYHMIFGCMTTIFVLSVWGSKNAIKEYLSLNGKYISSILAVVAIILLFGGIFFLNAYRETVYEECINSTYEDSLAIGCSVEQYCCESLGYRWHYSVRSGGISCNDSIYGVCVFLNVI